MLSARVSLKIRKRRAFVRQPSDGCHVGFTSYSPRPPPIFNRRRSGADMNNAWDPVRLSSLVPRLTQRGARPTLTMGGRGRDESQPSSRFSGDAAMRPCKTTKR